MAVVREIDYNNVPSSVSVSDSHYIGDHIANRDPKLKFGCLIVTVLGISFWLAVGTILMALMG